MYMRKKLQNNENNIKSSALNLFSNTGYYHTSIAQIAESSQIAVGSFYTYFDSKDEVVFSLINDFWFILYTKTILFINTNTDNQINTLNYMLDITIDGFIDNPDILNIITTYPEIISKYENNYTPNYYNKFIEEGFRMLEFGIARNMFSLDYNVDILKTFLFGSLTYSINSWINESKPVSVEVLKTNIRFFLMNGINIKAKNK